MQIGFPRPNNVFLVTKILTTFEQTYKKSLYKTVLVMYLN